MEKLTWILKEDEKSKLGRMRRKAYKQDRVTPRHKGGSVDPGIALRH